MTSLGVSTFTPRLGRFHQEIIMTCRRYNAARDENELAIVNALRKCGAMVERLSFQDAPDLLIGFRGKNYLIEVKTKNGKLSIGQRGWHERWNGQVHVARTIDDALTIIGALSKQ